jgi:PAS domain S-box-containing protein
MPLRTTAEFVLYRGRQNADASAVLAVALAAEYESPQTLRRLEHEYSLASDLDPAWAAKPLALTRHDGQTVLILNDPGGEPLDRVLEQNKDQPLDLKRFLRIAIGMTRAIGQVHRRGLIHKDIKPANVLVDDAAHVWLTGFGIASQLPDERQVPVAPEIIAGTLAYMAPEQTGRMNRSMDARSDLYSLGVTFYEMLTGRLPFAAADPLEWIHAHIARQPIPPVDCAAVPEVLSSLILKLLAKNAEERYQTAAGLEFDLRRCLAEWTKLGRIDPFPLGAQDVSEKLLIPENLYGREREIDALLAAFDRVVTDGTVKLVLVSGYSGIGKSSIVNELHKALVPRRGLFAAGKFDQYKRDIPYTTLAQAFQSLIHQILVKSEAEVEAWRAALAEAVGSNGQLVVDLIPEVEFILGRQSPVAELPPQEAHNRFQRVFRRFLGAFATRDHPLALFLDDLQWLDTATLELLESLMTDPDLRYLMLIGAYRDNEVTSSHPLMRTLGVILKAGTRVEEMMLTPLGLEDVRKLVADAVHCERERALPLALLVQQKTGGNPFFAIQFLRSLEEDGLLSFDPVTRAWRWDMNRISAQSYTDNVVDLMAERLKRLSDTTQEALKHLACLGNVTQVARLAAVQGETEEAVHAALRGAVRSGLVFRQENTYKFLHDRIQQAAYSLIPQGHRSEVHLRIGRALLASSTAGEPGEQVFEIANQLNWGAARLQERLEKEEAARLNLRAARRAKTSAAYASARTYFASGTALLDAQDWEIQHELTFSLWLELAACELLCGDMEKADQVIGELLQRAASDVEFADASCLKINLHVLTGEHSLAIDSALACLRLFGIDLPAHPSPERVRAEYDTVQRTLGARTIESLIDLSPMTDPKIQTAMQVLSALSGAATFTDVQLCCLLAARMVNLSIQHGMSGASAYAYACLGAALAPYFHRYSEGYRFGKLACDLVEKHGFTAYDTKVYHAMGLAAFWTQPLTSVIELRQAATRTATERGDLTFACYGMHQSITYLLTRNDPLDTVWRETQMALDFARKAKFRDVVDLIVSQQRFIASMQGLDATFSAFSDERFDEPAFEAQLAATGTPTVRCLHWIRKLKARYLSGDYAEAKAAADKARALLSISSVSLQLFDYFYYAALTVAALFEKASSGQQQEWRELLTTHQEQLREWAETYPPTFADKHELVSAELARIEGRDADAMRLYEQAIQSAREYGFVQNEAVAHDVAAQFYDARGFDSIAHACRRDARRCYNQWGAFGKVRQLDETYPRLREEGLPASTTSTIGTPTRQLDVETVVKASQALSSEIVLPKLIEKLMRIAVEHAGAERGLLILLSGDEPLIEATAVTGQGMVKVTVQPRKITPLDLPQSALQFVIRTREHVVFDDVSVRNLHSEDVYVRQERPRSVLCLPIVKQTQLIGALYLENNLTPRAFTADRVAVLELLASQAAISLENARLYSDLQRSQAYLAEGQRLSLTGSFGRNINSGEIFWSEETYEVFEHNRSVKPTLESVVKRIHPDDVDHVMRTINRATMDRTGFDLEYRLLRTDGSVKYLHVIARALEPSSDDLEFVGAVTDVTAAKEAEMKLRESEAYLAEAQRLAHTSSWNWRVTGRDAVHLSDEWYRIYGFDPNEGVPSWSERLQRIHPEDRVKWQKVVERAIDDKADYETMFRILLPDGSIKYVHTIGHPVLDKSGNLIEFVGSSTDITERKLNEEKLRRSEESLLEAQGLSHTGSWRRDVVSGTVSISPEIYRIYGIAPGEDTSKADFWVQRIHPEDRQRVFELVRRSQMDKADYQSDYRIVLPDGSIKHLHAVGHPVLNDSGDIIEMVGTSIDVTAAKQAEEKIRQSEMELQQILDFTPQQVAVLGSDRESLYFNQATLDYYGLTLDEFLRLNNELLSPDHRKYIHPDDWERVVSESQSKFLNGIPHEAEFRILRKDGTYRWFLFRYNPLRDEQGRITRWYVAGIDIEDRKQAEQRLQNENVALREEIAKASMFEEIVGTAPPLQSVLTRISKVAPTDSAVLITGETGTGKELVARAIHNRSRRSSRPFVSVNCAAIPRDLIASELFGHEKGAFTGATQRRIGRFELAEGGTIFLDEVGEVPPETQVALLRVLQEHEFERVGGTVSIRNNARLIAATNRDLDAAMTAGTFRSDLFYRLNVFPIEVPSLRERRDDIPLLVEYFIDRYARKAGKSFRAVNKRSLDLLQSYAWPGNIRELQNVIERSVIVCETENFSVDESWLYQPPLERGPQVELSGQLAAQEKEIIETALRESGGRVSGPAGAAAILGVHRSTLESKITSLNINKHRFKDSASSKES